jgi:hypothetical protein
MLPGRLPAQPVDGPPCRDLLPTAEIAASAAGPARLDDDVPDLGGESVGAPKQPPLRHDPAADAGPHRDQQHVGGSASRAESILAPGRHVGVVVHVHGETDAPADPFGHRELPPRHVGSEAHHTLTIDQSRRPHAHGGDFTPVGHEVSGHRNDGPGRRLPVQSWGLDHSPIQDRSVLVDVDQHAGDLRPPRVDPDGQRCHGRETTGPR